MIEARRDLQTNKSISLCCPSQKSKNNHNKWYGYTCWYEHSSKNNCVSQKPTVLCFQWCILLILVRHFARKGWIRRMQDQLNVVSQFVSKLVVIDENKMYIGSYINSLKKQFSLSKLPPRFSFFHFCFICVVWYQNHKDGKMSAVDS